MKIDIVILDDDTEIFSYYRSVLEPIPGIGRVRCCEDEFEFAQVLRMHKPHLVIADIHMRPTRGPEILRRHRDELQGVNVILLSCADGLEEETRVLQEDDVDVVAHLQKPLKPNDLYDILGYGID